MTPTPSAAWGGDTTAAHGDTSAATPVWRRPLQKAGRRSPRAVDGAVLAALRRGLGHEAGTVPAVWPFYTYLGRLSDGTPSAELVAEHITLGLFAIHQQSQSTPVHLAGASLGTALQHLRYSTRFSQEAVDRRVATTVSATSLTELAVHLRGLVTQLRGIDERLDYDQLHRDLVAWQDPVQVPRIRRSWGLDYFGARPQGNPADSATSTRTTDGRSDD